MTPSQNSEKDDRADGVLISSARGTNQSGMRARNERLVLTLVRRHIALAKAEIARATGLSAQTVSVIMRELEADGLLVKGEPVRGKVGQPSVPMRLCPEGAFFFGLKIGRRSAELVLTNFLGEEIESRQSTHRFPKFEDILSFTMKGINELTRKIPPEHRNRIAGLGIAMPFQIWDWARMMNLEPSVADAWRTRSMRDEIAISLPYPVFMQNDASAACGAELVFGTQEDLPSTFLYFYIGYFIGGGVVLNGALYTGKSGNAGAIGSMPVPTGSGSAQLIDLASLSGIEAMIEKRGESADSLWKQPERWEVDSTILDEWLAQASMGIAHAIAASVSVIDFELVMIDGWMPEHLRARLVEETRAAISKVNIAGLSTPQIVSGTVGPKARAMGAASLPLSERFLLEGAAFY